MRLALTLAALFAFVGPALAQGDSSESSTTQQGGAVRAMGRVGARQSSGGIEIPNYGGDVSAVRRLPIGTSPPRSRDFIPARWIYRRQVR